MFDFSGKNVLVTGASRGIGRAVSQAFAAGGATVAINYCSNDVAANESLQSLKGNGHLLVKADLSSAEGARTTVAGALSGLGRLDIVVNNAGIFVPHPLTTTDHEDWTAAWQRTLDVNLLGPAEICYLAGRHMIENDGGRIVNISSRGAFRGEPDCPAYGASKAGLNALSQSLAVELAPYNIFVGVVAPGFVETDMATDVLKSAQGDAVRAQSPLGRVARPEEVAHAVLFLASAGAEFSTGTIIDVNGASYLRS